MNGVELAKMLLSQAMTTRYGIAVSCENMNSAKSLFSMARRGDEALGSLTLKINPKDASELWILRTTRDGEGEALAQAQAQAQTSAEPATLDELMKGID